MENCACWIEKRSFSWRYWWSTCWTENYFRVRWQLGKRTKFLFSSTSDRRRTRRFIDFRAYIAWQQRVNPWLKPINSKPCNVQIKLWIWRTSLEKAPYYGYGAGPHLWRANFRQTYDSYLSTFPFRLKNFSYNPINNLTTRHCGCSQCSIRSSFTKITWQRLLKTTRSFWTNPLWPNSP